MTVGPLGVARLMPLFFALIVMCGGGVFLPIFTAFLLPKTTAGGAANGNIFFVSGFMLLGGIVCVVLISQMIRRRRQTSWIKVTPRALVFPEGEVLRVSPEWVRTVCVARQRYEIQYGCEPRWQTVHARQAFTGDLDPFAKALQDALTNLPPIG